MRFTRWMLPAGVVPALSAILAGPAAAQQPGSHRCDEATRRDSAVARGPNHGSLALVIGVFVVAPSALLLMPGACLDDAQELGFWRDHVSGYATVGGTVSGSRLAFSHSAGVEVFALGGYGEVRLDRYKLSGGVSMFDARAGYLIHPTRGTAGGVTVGWRNAPDVPDGWSGSGVLIGFPIILAACGERRPCWVQWEPAYLVSGHGLGFTPRLRLEMPLAHTPLLARVDMEAKGMKKRDPLSVSVGFSLRP
jgi:hypothetical protein